MKQLVQLLEHKSTFDELETELICVLREESEQIAGLKKAQARTKFPQLLIDTPATHTAAYSTQDFATYLIDKSGEVKSVITGTRYKRPSANKVVSAAKKSFK